VGVLFVFAISMFLKLIWYIVANVFKRSPDIDDVATLNRTHTLK
jgi:hypothetical protein